MIRRTARSTCLGTVLGLAMLALPLERVGASGAAGAAEAARVGIEFTPPESIWVGQQVVFFVEVLATTSFAEPPRFDLPPVARAILLKPRMFPLTVEKDIDGTRYTVQSHQFAVYPQQGGEIIVPPIEVRFSCGETGAEPIAYRLETDSLRLECKTPPGAENLSSLVATRKLEVTEKWEPEPGKAQVGAAFRRTVTWKAPDVMAMAFPSLPVPEVSGLAIYPGEPVVDDDIFRGQITGTRLETVTYLCEAPGDYELPALVISWFDLEEETIQRIQLPAVSFQVVAAPAALAEGAGLVAASRGGGGGWLLALVGLAVTSGVLLWPGRRRWGEPLRAWRHSLQERESAYFARLRRACRSDDPVAAFNSLMLWLDRTHVANGTATIAGFLGSSPDPEFARRLDVLQSAVLERTSWSGAPLAHALRRVRRERASRGERSSMPALPPLNPPSPGRG